MRHKLRWPGIAAQWLLAGTGPGARNHLEAGGFLRSDPGQDRPDVMIAFARWRCAARRERRSTGTATSCTSA